MARPCVLIVDDEVLLRLALGDFLESAGFKVIEAGSGDEAASILTREGPQIDLVFTDVRMPGMIDGFQLAMWVRDRHPRLPVFLASGDIGKAHTMYELAPDQPFFQKPYDMSAVVSQMLEALDKRAA